jgi:DNA polymerase III alpha subunit (gram-positive type)
MSITNTAVAIDTEHDSGRLIEIGFTTISLMDLEPQVCHSIPIKVDFEVSKEITELTGWTNSKLNKSGVTLAEATRRVRNICGSHRLLVVDSVQEVPFLESQLGISLGLHRFCISDMFTARTLIKSPSLEKMLDYYNLTFEGRLHRASDDSRNIARVFIRMISI